METFNTGLVITGLGMGLVFLTLVVVMYSIKALDALFKFKPEAVEVEAAPAVAERVAEVTVEAESAVETGAAEAAAIAVAIALARRVQAAFAPSGAMAPAGAAAPGMYAYGPRPAPLWMKPLPAGDDEPQGEVVMVVDVDPGPGTWKAQGRQDAVQ